VAKPDKLAGIRTAIYAEATKAAGAAIDQWSEPVEMRLRLAEGRSAEVRSELAGRTLPKNGASLDLLETLRAAAPKTTDADFPELAAMRAALQPQAVGYGKDLETLFDSLPETETPGRIAKYKRAKSDFAGYLWGGVSGFKIKEHPDEGYTTVQFVGEASSGSIVEELALLRAADLALNAGRRGLIIVDRRDYQRTQNTMMYGTVLRSDPIGYESSLDVVLVDPDNLPDRYKDVKWRVIDAGAVREQLGQVYAADVPAAVR
jgi:hypothetical protein